MLYVHCKNAYDWSHKAFHLFPVRLRISRINIQSRLVASLHL